MEARIILAFLSDYDDGMMMCVLLLSSMSGEHIVISILLGLVFLVEGVDKLPEDQRINVLAQLVEEEPVSITSFPANGLHLVLVAQPRPGPKQHLS